MDVGITRLFIDYYQYYHYITTIHYFEYGNTGPIHYQQFITLKASLSREWKPLLLLIIWFMKKSKSVRCTGEQRYLLGDTNRGS